MLRIWGRDFSNNVKKVLWCAEEIGLPYEHIGTMSNPFTAAGGTPQRPAAPRGLEPTIDDDGLVVWQSHSIVRYLAARYSDGVLHEPDPARRVLADRWMDWTISTFSQPFRDLTANALRAADGERDSAAVESALARCATLLPLAEAELAERPFLSGERLGIGDFPLGTLRHEWFQIPTERPDFPAIATWYGRLLTRPAYRKVVAVPLS